MMMTPLEIQNKEFKKRFGGYNANDVNDFIDKVYSEFDRMYRENADLKEKINNYKDKLENYSTIEQTLQNTLVIAQTTAEEIIQNARKKAETIIREGEIQANGIVAKANNSLVDIKMEFERNRKECQIFKTRYKMLVEAELENIKDMEGLLKESGSVETALGDNGAMKEDFRIMDNKVAEIEGKYKKVEPGYEPVFGVLEPQLPKRESEI